MNIFGLNLFFKTCPSLHHLQQDQATKLLVKETESHFTVVPMVFLLQVSHGANYMGTLQVIGGKNPLLVP